MPVGQAHDSVFSFVTQSSLGSLTSRTKHLDIVSASLAGEWPKVESKALGSASVRNMESLAYQSVGDIVLEGNFLGLDTLLYHAMGAKASAQQGSTAAYKHTLTLASAMVSPGLSMEIKKTSIQAFAYEACKINRLTLNQAPNEYLGVTIGVMGRAESKVSATSPSFPTYLPIHSSQLAVTLDAGAVTVNSLEITLGNGLELRPQVGSAIPKEYIRGSQGRRVTGSIEIDFEDTTQYDKLVANTTAALVATWTGAQIESPYNYALVATLPTIKWLGDPPTLSGRGPQTVTLNFVAVEATRGAQDEYKLELTNTATSIT